jgi:hypothetical protein
MALELIMGYDLHITRKAHWSDEDGPTIGSDEWLSILDSDPELSRATDAGDDTLAGAWKGDTLFWFDDCEVRCKNPDDAIVRKMVQIAGRLNATVQGDDGEIYREDGTSFEPDLPPPEPAPGLIDRIRDWFRRRREEREFQKTIPHFKVGARVRNIWGDRGTVLSVDRRACGGLGSLRVRMDDGREVDVAVIASGFELEHE